MNIRYNTHQRFKKSNQIYVYLLRIQGNFNMKLSQNEFEELLVKLSEKPELVDITRGTNSTVIKLRHDSQSNMTCRYAKRLFGSVNNRDESVVTYLDQEFTVPVELVQNIHVNFNALEKSKPAKSNEARHAETLKILGMS